MECNVAIVGRGIQELENLSLSACWASRKQIQSCHHEVWIHLLHVNARLVDRPSGDDKSCRPNSRKRNSPYDHSKERRQHR